MATQDRGQQSKGKNFKDKVLKAKGFRMYLGMLPGTATLTVFHSLADFDDDLMDVKQHYAQQ